MMILHAVWATELLTLCSCSSVKPLPCRSRNLSSDCRAISVTSESMQPSLPSSSKNSSLAIVRLCSESIRSLAMAYMNSSPSVPLLRVSSMYRVLRHLLDVTAWAVNWRSWLRLLAVVTPSSASLRDLRWCVLRTICPKGHSSSLFLSQTRSITRF